MLDVAIVGGGPAGLTAGLYCARAGLSCALFERLMAGGQASTTNLLENYPGFPGGIGGPELMMKFAEQAEEAGLTIEYEDVLSLDLVGAQKVLQLDGRQVRAKSVILAMGAQRAKLGVPGEEEFVGRGVSYCATCDGAFYAGKRVAVIGGGDTAIEDALYLSARSHVTLIHRRAQLRATGRAVERAKANPNIEFCLGAPPERIEKSGAGLAVALANGVRIEADGVFIAVGTRPETALVAGQVALDEAGYILAGEDTRTSVPGVFAAGDARKKPLKQVATAVGDGATAAAMALKYVQEECS